MDQFFNDQVDVAIATIYNEYHVVLGKWNERIRYGCVQHRRCRCCDAGGYADCEGRLGQE